MYGIFHRTADLQYVSSLLKHSLEEIVGQEGEGENGRERGREEQLNAHAHHLYILDRTSGQKSNAEFLLLIS